MSILASRKLSRAAVVALTLASAGVAYFATGSEPALALCKYGTPHCINKYPGPAYPSVGGVKIPDSTWKDPDCGYYGNCQTTQRTAPGKPKLPVAGGTNKVQAIGIATPKLPSAGATKLPTMGMARMSGGMGGGMGGGRHR